MNKASSPLDLTAIEARSNAASPGPWVKVVSQIRQFSGRPEDSWDVFRASMIGGLLTRMSNRICRIMAGAEDAAFIAHAREDIPALITRIRELESPQAPALTPAEAGADHIDILRRSIKQLVADAINFGKNSTDADKSLHFQKMMVGGNDWIESQLTALTQQPQEGLRWTREKPVMGGRYWYRVSPTTSSDCWDVLDISVMAGYPQYYDIAAGDYFPLQDAGEFAGPIPEPQEDPKEGREV